MSGLITVARTLPGPSRSVALTVAVAIAVSHTLPAPARAVTLSRPAVGIARTLPAASRTIHFKAADQVAISRLLPAFARAGFLRIPPTQIRDVTFTTSHRISVARTLPPPIRRVGFHAGVLAGPFYVCWANPTETTFGPQFQINQLDFVYAKLDQREGQKATLRLDIKNPHVGLLNPTRQQWLWFSWRDILGKAGTAGTVYPLFFGHLVGIPTGIKGEQATLEFDGEAIDWVAQKQQLAETLKVRPYYDPIFLPPTQRDDPDGIVQGYPASYHYDRIAGPNSVTLSEWNVGEDGILFFGNDSGSAPIIYDSLIIGDAQPPLRAMKLELNVNWAQTATGILDFGTQSIKSYYDGIQKDWPAVGTDLGSGWNVWASAAVDTAHVDITETMTYKYTYKNQETTHTDGDTMTDDITIQWPMCGSLAGPYQISDVYQPHILDSNTGLNIPADAQVTQVYVGIYKIGTHLALRYRANRARTETATAILLADVQQVDVMPLNNIETETLQLNAVVDIGRPLINVYNWSTKAGQFVDFGTIIFPNFTNALNIPGAQSYQVVVEPGTLGTTQPNYSDVVGEETTDGTAILASMGLSPNLDPGDWSRLMTVPTGYIICPSQPPFADYSLLTANNLDADTPVGTGVSYGQIVQVGSFFYQCTLGGITGIKQYSPSFIPAHGAVTVDGTAEWTGIGSSLPNGDTFFMAVQGGQVDEIYPEFNYATGGLTTDGGVVWRNIGVLGGAMGSIPIGGTVGNVTAANYLAQDRGLWSFENGLARMRAKMLRRARNFEVDFDVSWADALAVTCRKNVTLTDSRLPGGTATGKVIEYSLECNPDELTMIGHVKIGCTTGNGMTTITAPKVLASGDCGYTPPSTIAADDGLTFPLTTGQVILADSVNGSLSQEFIYVNNVIAAQRSAALQALLGNASNPAVAIAAQAKIAATPQFPIFYELTLKPVADQSFASNANVIVTPLQIVKTVDLSAS